MTISLLSTQQILELCLYLFQLLLVFLFVFHGREEEIIEFLSDSAEGLFHFALFIVVVIILFYQYLIFGIIIRTIIEFIYHGDNVVLIGGSFIREIPSSFGSH